MTKEEKNQTLKDKIEFLTNCLDDRDKSIELLEEENKKLKSDLAFKNTMLDNVKAEYESSQNVIKKMKAELERYKKQYEHSMGEDS